MTDSQVQINITLGTAGHIDHGKTALIRLLTGCETDRLKEEKERGMSIELGFAPCRMGDLEVGIVDVPGHEHFVKTMVAGATGIDGVIFVVAADDGIMPQTREHLDILTLLGVKYGMIALTKIDLVTPDRIETVMDELKRFCKSTFLENAAICPLSTITGEGFDGFYKALKNLVPQIQPKTTEGIFRMPIERVFSVKGFGTIVSGIPTSGAAELGDELVLLPDGTKSRIRAIQVYGKDARQVRSGQCAALNLPQIDANAVERGQVLTKGTALKAAQWFLCSLRVLDSAEEAIKNGRSYKFHTGTSEVTAVVYVLDDQTQEDCSMLVQLRTQHPVAAGVCDPFILRDLSPTKTIGGGYIIEAVRGRVKRGSESALDLRLRSGVVRRPETFIAYCLENGQESAFLRAQDIAERVQQTHETVSAVLRGMASNGDILQVQDCFIHRIRFGRYEQAIRTTTHEYHHQHPDSPGIDEDALLQGFNEPKPLMKSLLSMLLQDKKLVLSKGRIALPEYRQQFDPAQKALLEKVESLFVKRLFSPPGLDEISAALEMDAGSIQKTLRLLIEQQILLRVEEGLYFHRQAIETAKERIAEHVKGKGRLESVDFKYLIDTTRKYAIPLLDYMDKIGFTRRLGNTRFLKP